MIRSFIVWFFAGSQVIAGVGAGMAAMAGRWDEGCFCLLLYLALHFTSPEAGR